LRDNEEVIIKWNETTLEIVAQYNYLGVLITNDGKIDKEVKQPDKENKSNLL
jgi:hypothetical protein